MVRMEAGAETTPTPLTFPLLHGADQQGIWTMQQIAGLETEQAGPPFKELEPIPSKRTPEAGDDECVAEISKCEAVPTATQHKHLLLNIGRGPNIEYPLKMKRISGL